MKNMQQDFTFSTKITILCIENRLLYLYLTFQVYNY